MLDVRANTQVIVPIGVFVDVGDGFTPETGVALSTANEAELLKHGSTTVVSIAAATWAAITSMDGHYALTLTTSHTDTEGQLTIAVNDDDVCLPVVARFRVLSEAAYDSLYVAKDAGFMDVNIKTVARTDTTTTGADNLALQYDTTGLTGDTFPATQASVSNIANVGSAVSKTAKPSPNGFTITTGTNEVNTEDSTFAHDGTVHSIDSTVGALDVYYEFAIGSGTPSSVTVTGFLNGNNDDLEVYGYDWVAAAWVQIGTMVGKTSTANEVNSYELFVDMVGSGSDEGTVRIRFTDGAFTLTSATLSVDQIYVSFSQGAEGYDNGSVWIDTGASNTNTEVGIDGVARNPVSTIGAANTLLASTNLHRLVYAPGSTVTFAASQTDEIHHGHDFTVALGIQDITGIYLDGAIVSGIATATARFVISNCQLNACTFDNDGLFDHCSIAGTQTIGQAGTYTYHNCYNESGSEITIDFAAVGATTVHLFQFHGEINFTNMAAGDVVHITGAGTITTTTCTAGTIEHDGFFEYTDAGGNVTEQQSDIKVAVDAVLVDTSTTIPGTITTAQTDLTAILADTNELQTDDVPGLIAALNNLSAANVATELATYDGPTKAEMDTAHGLLATEAKQDIIDTNVDDIETAIGTAGAGLTDLGGMSTAMKAEVNAEADTALTDAVLAKGVQKNQIITDIPFLMVDSTDHVTPKTGLTVAGTRSIDGAAYGAVTGTFAEVANGTYQFDASAADVNGDFIMFRFTGTGADDVFLPIQTTP